MATAASKSIEEVIDPKTGAFNRPAAQFRQFISAKPNAEFPPEKGRYHLYVSYACPWGKFIFPDILSAFLMSFVAHRTLIVRQLKGLEDIVDYTVVHWHMDLGGKGLSNSTTARTCRLNLP
jgi:glutathionyl-hydroquinone reductase